MGIFECFVLGCIYWHVLPICKETENWDTWILLKAGLSNFSQSMKEMRNWDFKMLANRLYFQIFPNLLERWIIGIFENLPRLHFPICTNSQRNWKLGLLNSGKEISNEQERMNVGSFHMNFKSIQNSKSQCFLHLCWMEFFTISEE